MVEFAGFEMPVQYSSILEEHAAVRQRAGLFDVSHMGQIELEGPAAIATAEHLLTRPVASLASGRVRYGLLCNPAGAVIDDVPLSRLAPDALLLCVNAANIEKDWRWVASHSPPEAGARNRSDETGLLALQGPLAESVLARVAPPPATTLGRWAFTRTQVAGRPALVSRTGYTGSDGFEIYTASADLVVVFESLLAEGQPLGLIPVGLGARDTLRLEAAMPLYGHELDETTSPLEAGLGRYVKLARGGFIGAEAIARRHAAGERVALVGFELLVPGVARAEYAVAHGGRTVGRVTSGGPSPTLGKSIGLAYVPPDLAAVGTPLEILIRGRACPARVVETPFVQTRAEPPETGG